MTTMSIQHITAEDICTVIREALRSDRLPLDTVSDFVAAVDWSGAEAGRVLGPVAASVGQLEQWEIELREGEISEADFRRCLVSLLPDDEAGNQLRAVGT